MITMRLCGNSPSNDVHVQDELYFSTGGVTVSMGVNNLTAWETHEIPEPGTLVLLATGLIGLLGCMWRKRK